MNLEIDLLAGSGRRRRDRILLVLSGVAAVIAFVFYSDAREQLQEAEMVAARERKEADEARNRAEEAARGPARKQAAAVALAEYRLTLPWVEVLEALEAVEPLQAVDVHFSVDEGVAKIVVTGAADESFSKSLAELEHRLPKWRVVVIQEKRSDGRATATLKLIDTLRPAVPLSEHESRTGETVR